MTSLCQALASTAVALQLVLPASGTPTTAGAMSEATPMLLASHTTVVTDEGVAPGVPSTSHFIYLPIVQRPVALASAFRDVYEPDEPCGSAKVIADGQTQTHTFATASGAADVDYLMFSVPGTWTRTYTYSVDIAPLPESLNARPFIQMEWPCGTPLGHGGNYGLIFWASGGTTVHFRLTNSLGRVGAGTAYTVHLYANSRPWSFAIDPVEPPITSRPVCVFVHEVTQ
jgi:hypothetical protein